MGLIVNDIVASTMCTVFYLKLVPLFFDNTENFLKQVEIL